MGVSFICHTIGKKYKLF